MVLRGLAAAAAATAVVGGVVMRRWDAQAGKQVADLTRARASDEWRHEERVAELETDLEESRELRVKLEQRLRAKRAELAGLRNEHASLLRRYATAETERASVLEERRVLEIEAGAPARALPPGAVPGPAEGVGAVAVPAQAEAEAEVAAEAEVDAEGSVVEAGVEVDAEGAEGDAVEEVPAASAVFSPEGSRLFLRAKEALARFDEDGESPAGESSESPSSKGEPPTDEPPNNEPPKGDGPSDDEPVKTGSGAVEVEAGDAAGSETEPALEDDAPGKPEAVDGHERAAAGTPAGAVARTAQQPSGHFIAPTAVAVVPATPVRRPAVQGASTSSVPSGLSPPRWSPSRTRTSPMSWARRPLLCTRPRPRRSSSLRTRSPGGLGRSSI